MFKPHVTVACVVHAQDKFLIVEETIIDFPDNGSLVTPNITKNLIRVLLY